MGRVSRYKKVKSIDPFAKNGSWKSDVGDCSTFRRVKKKSKTAIKMKEQKLNKLQRRMRGGNKNDNIIDRKKSGGCNGYGDDDGYDLPPDGEDEFDLKDILGSIKKQKNKPDPLLDGIANKMPIVKPSVSMSSTSTTTSSTNNKSTDNKKSKKKQQKIDSNMKKISSKANIKYDGTQKITAKTSTKEIIEACSNPKLQKQSNSINGDDTTTTNKQEKRKLYLAKKKQKKRKRSSPLEDSDNEDYQQALQSLHSQQHTSSTSSPTTNKQNKQPKQHEVQQPNYTHTMIARSSLNDQVERPPTFTTLPRGAHKLLKNNKNKKDRQKHEGKDTDGDDSDKAKRIRKEQLALEAMRERVMKQYAVLRESRRSGR